MHEYLHKVMPGYGLAYIAGWFPSALLLLVCWVLLGVTRGLIVVPVALAYICYFGWQWSSGAPRDEQNRQMPIPLACFMAGLFLPLLALIGAKLEPTWTLDLILVNAIITSASVFSLAWAPSSEYLYGEFGENRPPTKK